MISRWSGYVRLRFIVLGWVYRDSMRERVSCRKRDTRSWSNSRRAFSLAARYILSFSVCVLVWLFWRYRYGIEDSLLVYEKCRLWARKGECC